MSNSRLDRRQLLSAGALLGSSLAIDGSAQAKRIGGEVPWEPGKADAPTPPASAALEFFAPPEAAFVDAAVSRLIPQDQLGPGAKEAGATIFIDRQLAGSYGRAQRWYMQGPWAEGTKSQGFQSRLTPAQLYRAAIGSIDNYCRQQYGGKSFAELGAGDQDKILEGLEKNEVKLDQPYGSLFFEILLQNTMEGFWSDPIYGGNRDMVGWKLIGFPGARYDYREFVGKHGQRYGLPPVGLRGRPDWSSRS